jgi:hypothetical protein
VSDRIVVLRYPAASQVEADAQASAVSLSLDTSRVGAGLTGRLVDPALFRDLLLTTHEIRASDLRYKGRDRTAYLAYLAKSGRKVSAALWEAQKQYLELQYGEQQIRPRGLDPLLTVDPDELSIEVFSRDESAWARVAFHNALFAERTAAHGTAPVDLSDDVVERVARLRTYQPVNVRVGGPGGGGSAAREVELPDGWLRGFLQVQSAATVPAAVVRLAPIDLYDVLHVLTVRRARQAPRGLRFELVPGLRPRVVLEPWEIAIEGHAEPYAGSAPRVARVYGRQRLLTLARLLPHLKGLTVHLLGAGLPSFWALDLGLGRATVALTSWSESAWSSAASFDALVPPLGGRGPDDPAARAAALLVERGPLPLETVAGALGLRADEARTALKRACLRGQVLYDLDRGQYRPRMLLPDPVDEAALRYASPREAIAHRLLGDPGAGAQALAEVHLTKVHVAVGEGTDVEGEVRETLTRRVYSPRFSLDLEDRVTDAWCNCPTFLASGLREGPCEHMIALYIQRERAAQEAERLRGTEEGRKTVRAETRTLLRREADGRQLSLRLSLDDRVVRVATAGAAAGEPLGPPRHQRTWYDTDAEARDAYFARLDELTAQGFIDTGSGA